MEQWNLNQSKLRNHSPTSTGVSVTSFDSNRGVERRLEIQLPSFDLTMSDSSLSFKTDWSRLPSVKLIALLKCLLILQTLPQDALEEAAENLIEIADFYSDRLHQASLPTVPTHIVEGKLISTQIRPPIVLEP